MSNNKKGCYSMSCEECNEMGNRVMEMFIDEDYTVDEAKAVLEKVLESMNVIIGQRKLN